jgi:hydroxyacylglutathione hydrolase
MKRLTFPVGALGCNCTILADEEAGEALVIDPGDEADALLMLLAREKLRVVGILHTHAHFDHVGGTARLAEVTKAPTYLHPGDDFLCELAPMQARMFGLPDIVRPSIDHALDDGLGLRFGRFEVGVLHTPGHTPGSCCLVVPQAELCLSGDTLFAGGIGRTDLPGGDGDAIVRSIKDRLYTLHGAVEVIPGHGPFTTIDEERSTNPFVRA